MTSVAFTLNDISMGGIQRVTCTMANALSKKGLDITLIDLTGRTEFYKVQTNTYIKPTNLQYISWRALDLLSKAVTFKRTGLDKHSIINKLFRDKKYDFIILNPELFFAFDQIRNLQPQAQIYLWMHNEFRMYVKRYFANNLKMLFDAASSANGIICLEENTARHWREFNKRVIKIYNPLTLPINGTISSLTSHKIACVSRPAREHKGLDYLLEIAESLPKSWTIEFAGEGSDQNWFEQEIKRRNLQKSIILKGALKGEALSNHYSSASLFLSTSRWEGFQLTAVEAMSRGLPFLAFDLPALREITENGKDGLLAPMGDIAMMDSNISKLTSSMELRQEYAARSLRRAQDFSLDKITDEWINKIFMQKD